MKEVIYCESLFKSKPKEIKMDYELALKLYHEKIQVLKGSLFKDACFVGVKDLNNKWIIKND